MQLDTKCVILEMLFRASLLASAEESQELSDSDGCSISMTDQVRMIVCCCIQDGTVKLWNYQCGEILDDVDCSTLIDSAVHSGSDSHHRSADIRCMTCHHRFLAVSFNGYLTSAFLQYSATLLLRKYFAYFGVTVVMFLF